MIFDKRMFATKRVPIGRIWTIFRRSKAGPRGHILGPFPAPGGQKKARNKYKTFWKIPKKKLEPTMRTGGYVFCFFPNLRRSSRTPSLGVCRSQRRAVGQVNRKYRAGGAKTESFQNVFVLCGWVFLYRYPPACIVGSKHVKNVGGSKQFFVFSGRF